jgi:hypothetical protein
MNFDTAIVELESFWDPDEGVFWQLRQGKFIESEVNRFLVWLRQFKIDGDAALPRRFVSLLWYVPLFMQWQVDRVKDTGGDVIAYSKIIVEVSNELERILGTP